MSPEFFRTKVIEISVLEIFVYDFWCAETKKVNNKFFVLQANYHL